MVKDGITLAGAEGVYGCMFDVGDDYWIALYEEPNLDDGTTNYTARGEASGLGYSAGGKPLGRPKISREGNCFIWDFDDVAWANSSITAEAALIYNKTKQRSLAVLAFPKTISRNGLFRVTMPPPTVADGCVRFYF